MWEVVTAAAAQSDSPRMKWKVEFFEWKMEIWGWIKKRRESEWSQMITRDCKESTRSSAGVDLSASIVLPGDIHPRFRVKIPESWDGAMRCNAIKKKIRRMEYEMKWIDERDEKLKMESLSLAYISTQSYSSIELQCKITQKPILNTSSNICAMWSSCMFHSNYLSRWWALLHCVRCTMSLHCARYAARELCCSRWYFSYISDEPDRHREEAWMHDWK